MQTAIRALKTIVEPTKEEQADPRETYMASGARNREPVGDEIYQKETHTLFGRMRRLPKTTYGLLANEAREILTKAQPRLEIQFGTGSDSPYVRVGFAYTGKGGVRVTVTAPRSHVTREQLEKIWH